MLPPPQEPAVVEALSAALHLPPSVCTLLARRGFPSPPAARDYLRPRLEHLHDPAALTGIDRAVDRLARAVQQRETVLVHGDYDVDGICATTLVTRTLRYYGARAVPFVPHRLTDGYDLSEAGVRAAAREGATLVVTCDCGTSALAPVQSLRDAGIDVIVSDHHLPGSTDTLPNSFALLNPRQPGCTYPDKDLAAVGVAFKLMLALAARLGANANPVYRMLDLVALATVADVVPLRGENRVLVRYGLRLMAETTNVGLRALIRASGLEGKALTAGRIGFILAPRLNAVGRLGHAARGIELLLCEEEAKANVIARELEELNRRRQELDRATLVRARALIEQIDLDATYGIVLAQAGWHPGVIGIVASRLVEETGRPALLVALDGTEGKGSGRSIPAFDLHAGLKACRDLLTRFGGHRAAAGLTIAADRVPELARRFNEVAHERLAPDDLIPELRIDAELPLEAVTDDLEALLRHFEPFGMGNPAPLLASRRVKLALAPRVVGEDGLRLRFATETGTIDAIGWGMADLAAELAEGAVVDIAYRLERDVYQDRSRLQLRLADVRR